MNKYSKYPWYISLEEMATMPKNNNPKYLIIHHAASNNSFEEVQEYHIIGRKLRGLQPFNNIGYHFYILKDGTVRQGRPQHRNGAHAIGYNAKSLGVCLQGNYSKENTPPEAQKQALRRLLKALRSTYAIPLSNIIPHRAVAATECFGSNLPDKYASNLLVEEATSIDSFTTRDLLKEARTRPDFWRELAKLFS